VLCWREPKAMEPEWVAGSLRSGGWSVGLEVNNTVENIR